MNTITVEQIVIFHRKIVNVTGGSDGIRDRTLIDSAFMGLSMGISELVLPLCCYCSNLMT